MQDTSSQETHTLTHTYTQFKLFYLKANGKPLLILHVEMPDSSK